MERWGLEWWSGGVVEWWELTGDPLFWPITPLLLQYSITPLLTSLPLPDQCHHYALYLQFLLRNQVGITGIFRTQIRFVPLHDKSFQRDLAINQRRHDIARTRLHTVLDDGDISIDNIFAEHGISTYLEAESARAGFDSQCSHINQNAAFFLLSGIFRQAGGNNTIDWDINNLRP